MGLFCVDSSQRAIIELISSWCNEKRFIIVRQVEHHVGDGTSVDMEARPGSERAVSWVCWHVTAKEERSIVQVQVRPGRTLSALTCLSACFCGGSAFYALFFIASFSNFGFLSLWIVALLFGLIFLIVGRWLLRMQVTVENSFWEMVPTKELLRNVEGHFGPLWFEVTMPLVGSVLMFLLFATNKAIVFGFWLLSFSVCLFVVVLLDLSVKDSYSRWKMLTAHVTNRWIHVCFRAVLPFALLCGLNSLFMLAVEDPNVSKNKVGVVLQKVVSTAFSEKAFSRTSGVFEEENAWILRSAVAKGAERARGKDVSSYVIEKKLRAIGVVMLAGFALLLIFYLISLRRLFNVANEWGRMTGYVERPKGLFVPPVHLESAKTHWALSLAIVTHYLLGSFITVITGVISFDAICYVVSKQSLIIKPLGVLYAWIFAFGSMALSRPISRIGGDCLLITLSLPFIIFVVINIKRTVSFVSAKIMWQSRNKAIFPADNAEQRVGNIQEFLRKTCERFGLTVPMLIIEEKSKQPICIRGGLIRKTSTLRANQNLLENLTPEELEAAVAHELGHLIQGLRKIEWLKLLSVVTMHSNYYLTLCLDLLQREVEADRFAIDAGVKPDMLSKAMVKASVFDFDYEPSLWKRISSRIAKGLEKVLRVEGAGMVNEFFFGEAIVGYTHPLLSERLAAISTFEGSEAAVWPETGAN